MNAIVSRQNTAPAVLDENRLIEVMQSSLYPGAKPESVAMVLGYCQARGLDPLRKPVHIVPMYVKPAGQKGGGSMQDVVMPGIALYRIEASRTGEYAGKGEPVFGSDVTKTWETTDYNGNTKTIRVTFPSWCSVTVYRMVAGQPREFTAREFWMENYATAGRDSDAPNAMWQKRAYGQLAKCAEAQALRMAFPEATGGEATAEEMEGKAMEPRDVPSVRQPEPMQSRPTLPGGLVESLQNVEKLPLVGPDGALHSIPKASWLKAVKRALASLQSPTEIGAWRASNGAHLAATAENDADLVKEAEAAITARVADFAPEEPEMGDAYEGEIA